MPEIGPPGSESGGRKRAHGNRPAARLRKHRMSHRPPYRLRASPRLYTNLVATPICLTLRVETSFTYISLFIRQRLGLHHQRKKSNRCLGYEGVTSQNGKNSCAKSHQNVRSWLTTDLST